MVDADHRFCATCWSSLHFLGPPWCASCALPLDQTLGEEVQCGACLSAPPRHAGARAAVAYGDVAKTLALRLKYGRRTGFAGTAARQMLRLMPEDTALIVPVPLHRWRLWSRGFNQAALIAAALARLSGVATAPDLLERRRATPVLRGLGRRGRAKAVQGAFAVAPRRAQQLKGQSVVLVDDVYTTGATTDACVRVLLSAGAAKVTILCWARVLDEDGVPTD